MPPRTSIVYKYGLPHGATVGSDHARRQMRLAHDHYNDLISIERWRRWEYREALAAHQSQDIDSLVGIATEASDAVKAVYESINGTRAKRRTRVAIAPEVKAELDAAKEAQKVAREAVRAARAAHRARPNHLLAVHLQRINDVAHELALAAREYVVDYRGLMWGSYQLVDVAMHDASSFKSRPLWDKHGKPNDPSFRPWRGEGRIGVQFIKALTLDQAFGEGTQVRLAPVNPAAWSAPSRGDRRRAARTTLTLRVGSTPKRKPVWASFPMIMHRPMPEGSLIRRVDVTCVRIGSREHWTVEITVDVTNAAPLPVSAHRGFALYNDDGCHLVGDNLSGPPTGGTVGLDLGWRVIDGDLRVAAWRGDDGRVGELRLTRALWSQLTFDDGLASIRKKEFNVALKKLVADLKGLTLPTWLTAPKPASTPLGAPRASLVASLPHWESEARLRALVRRWRDNRFAGDTAAYDEAERWRYHDYHLWEWETSQRAKALGHRREIFRLLAALLTRAYGTLRLEEFDLRAVARRPAPEEPAGNPHAGGNRVVAAPSELREALEHAFKRTGGTSTRRDAAYTTQTCALCGFCERFDAASAVRHTCGRCGEAWDQDENAAIHILNGEPLPGARSNERAAE